MLNSRAAQKLHAKYNVTTDFPHLDLHAAAASGNVGLVRYALKHGQPVNSVLDGVLPLHAAASGGSELVVQILIDAGADVNSPRLPRKYSLSQSRSGSNTGGPIVGTSGSTPLHFAAANGHTHIIGLLFGYGANPLQPDKHGVTPEQLARETGHEECVKVLKDASVTWVKQHPATSSSSSSTPGASTSTSAAAGPSSSKIMGLMGVAGTECTGTTGIRGVISKESLRSAKESLRSVGVGMGAPSGGFTSPFTNKSRKGSDASTTYSQSTAGAVANPTSGTAATPRKDSNASYTTTQSFSTRKDSNASVHTANTLPLFDSPGPGAQYMGERRPSLPHIFESATGGMTTASPRSAAYDLPSDTLPNGVRRPSSAGTRRFNSFGSTSPGVSTPGSGSSGGGGGAGNANKVAAILGVDKELVPLKPGDHGHGHGHSQTASLLNSLLPHPHTHHHHHHKKGHTRNQSTSSVAGAGAGGEHVEGKGKLGSFLQIFKRGSGGGSSSGGPSPGDSPASASTTSLGLGLGITAPPTRPHHHQHHSSGSGSSSTYALPQPPLQYAPQSQHAHAQLYAASAQGGRRSLDDARRSLDDARRSLEEVLDIRRARSREDGFGFVNSGRAGTLPPSSSNARPSTPGSAGLGLGFGIGGPSTANSTAALIMGAGGGMGSGGSEKGGGVERRASVDRRGSDRRPSGASTDRRGSNATSFSDRDRERRPSTATSIKSAGGSGGGGAAGGDRRPSTSGGGSPPSSYHPYASPRSRPGTAGSLGTSGGGHGGREHSQRGVGTDMVVKPASAPGSRLRADSSSSDMSGSGSGVGAGDVNGASPRSGGGGGVMHFPIPSPRSPTTPTPANHGASSDPSLSSSSTTATTVTPGTSVGGPVNSTAPFRPRQNSTVSAPSPLASEWSAAALGLEDTDMEEEREREREWERSRRGTGTDDVGVVGDLEMDYHSNHTAFVAPAAVAVATGPGAPYPPPRPSALKTMRSGTTSPTTGSFAKSSSPGTPRSGATSPTSSTFAKSSSTTPTPSSVVTKDADVKRRPSILKNASSTSSSSTSTMGSMGMSRHHARSGSGGVLVGGGGSMPGSGASTPGGTRALRFESSAGDLGSKYSQGPKTPSAVTTPTTTPHSPPNGPSSSSATTSPTTSPTLAPPGTRVLRSSSSAGSLKRNGSKRVGGYYPDHDATQPLKRVDRRRGEIEEEDEDAEGEVVLEMEEEGDATQLHVSPFGETFEAAVHNELAARVTTATTTTAGGAVVKTASGYPAARGEEFSDEDADGDDDERMDEVGMPFWTPSSANTTPTTATSTTTSPNSAKHPPYASLTYPGGLGGSYPGGTMGSHYYHHPHFIAPKRPRGPSFASTTSSYSTDAGAAWDYPQGQGQGQGQIQASPRSFGAINSPPIQRKGSKPLLASPQHSPSLPQPLPSSQPEPQPQQQQQRAATSPAVVVHSSPETESERVLLLSPDPAMQSSRDKVLLLSPPPLGKRRSSSASTNSSDGSPVRSATVPGASTPGPSSRTLSAPASSSTLSPPVVNDDTLSAPDGRLRGDSISSVSTDGTTSLMPGSSTDNGTEGSPSSFGVSDEAFAATVGGASPRPFAPFRAKFSPKTHSPKLPGGSFPPTVYEGDSTSDHTTAHGEDPDAHEMDTYGTDDDLDFEEDDEGGADLSLDIRNISSHAEAQSLVQKAQKEILEGDGEERGNLSLAEQLAAYGETLAIERRFARGEAQRRHWESRGQRGSESDEEEQELRGERPMSPVDMAALVEPLSPRSTSFANKTPMRDILGNPIPSAREALRNATTKKEARPTTPKKVSETRALPAPAANITAPRVNRVMPPFEKHPVIKTTSGRSHRRRATDPELSGAPGNNLRLNPNQPPAGIEIIKTLPTPTDSPRSALGESPRGGVVYRPAPRDDDDRIQSDGEDDEYAYVESVDPRSRAHTTLPPGLPRRPSSPAMEPLERITTAPAHPSIPPASRVPSGGGPSKFAKTFIGEFGVAPSAADVFWSREKVDKGGDTASTTGKKKFGLKSLVQSLKGK